MYLLYSFLLTLGVIALLPRFAFDAFRHGKYVAGFRERLGRLPAMSTGGRPVIWLHCVSVGEAQAARPLARALLEKFPSHFLVVSTTTLTGQRIARDVFREDATVIYFPFDWAWTVRRSLRQVNPSVVLIMETELWPNFLRECKRRRVPVALVNGRLSERSFRRYRIVRRFVKRILESVAIASVQTENDANRLSALGLAQERLIVSGNIKFDAKAEEPRARALRELRKRFQLDHSRPLILAASTHSPEERIVLNAFKLLRATPGTEKVRLLIAPRHPERFSEVASLLETSGAIWCRRSDPVTERDSQCDVILLDSIGELRSLYSVATVVFVGGSLAPTGGHNILEPAAVRACTITGAHTFNFTEIVNGFLAADALVQLPPLADKDAPMELAKALSELLANDLRRRTLGDNALAVLERNRGATARTIELLTPIFNASSHPSQQLRTDGPAHDAASA